MLSATVLAPDLCSRWDAAGKTPSFCSAPFEDLLSQGTVAPATSAAVAKVPAFASAKSDLCPPLAKPLRK